MSTHKTTSPDTAFFAEEGGRKREVLGLLAASATALLVLSLWSYDGGEGRNLVGPVGTGLASLLISAFGVCAWILPFELSAATWRIFRGRPAILGLATIASTLTIALLGCAILHLAFGETRVFGEHLAGGVLGEILGELIKSLFGLAGAYIVSATMLMVTIVLRTRVSVIAGVRTLGRHLEASRKRVRGGWSAVTDAWQEARELEQEELEGLAEGHAVPDATWDETLEEDDAELGAEQDSEDAPGTHAGEGGTTEIGAAEVGTSESGATEIGASKGKQSGSTSSKPNKSSRKAHAPQAEDSNADLVEDTTSDEQAQPEKRAVKIVHDERGPRIVQPPSEEDDDDAPSKPAPSGVRTTSFGNYEMPPMELLDKPPKNRVRVDPERLKANAKRLEEKLASYGVKGRVDEIHPGPVVTMYEFEPQSGIKISKIAGLENDLALALAAQKVRIVAPIPGKARVGIELPNDNRQMVHLRSILEDERWQQHKGALPFALGKDIAGQPVYADLAKMPHLLVAGATGAGKSVGLNVMLASLLYKKTPEECRMLMIDPKVVELAVFDDIPHMLLPVVTDMQKAALALKWAVDEMERRYQLFADAGSRNITTYNKKVAKVKSGELHPEKMRRARRNVDNDEPITIPEKLPYIVVVVDEFADLMMVAAKEVEGAIARLAQKARAAGIHVILATQRPSVDVITGMIKANFPARMAFKVSQRQDSSTILGRVGAQNLLGKGDMLMLPPGSSDLQRVHCAFIGEDEVNKVCDHLRAQGTPVYDENILKPREPEDTGDNEDNPLYDRAIAIVATAGYCSISHLQRKLSIGYNKAATLVEQLEEDGVVGPPSSAAGGRREVFVQPM